MRFRSTLPGVLSLGLAAFVLVGCASTGGGSGGALSDMDLSLEDIQTVEGEYDNVYDFLSAHARADFSTRSGQEELYVHSLVAADQEQPALVVIDGRQIGDPIPRLEAMSLTEVGTLEILRTSEARMEYGGGGFEGAVVIRTRGRL